LAWLYSQGLGIVCGQATVLLLALGSIVLAATREGVSRAIAMDDLTGFFAAPAAAHLWFYLLVPVLGLYALNVFLATWRSVSSKWRGGLRDPRMYAAAVIHVAFLVALFAHLVGGFGGSERGTVELGPGWRQLDRGRDARVASLEVERLPDGGLKQLWATVDLRDAAGAISTETISYNGPLSRGLGSDLFLVLRATAIGVVELARAGQRCRVAVDEMCQLGEAQILPLYIHPPTHGQDPVMARIRLRQTAGSAPEELWLAKGKPHPLADGTTLALEAPEVRPALLLRGRHAPGNPWALLSALLLALGLALMWHRFV
jgi:hypothetical protein